MSCQNNVKQIALAALNFESSKGGLPPFSKFGEHPFGDDLFVGPADSSQSQGGQMYSWVIPLLPFVEESSLYEQFNLDFPVDAQVDSRGQPIDPQAATIESFLCPSESGEERFFQDPGKNFGRRFAKGNYAAYVSPIHLECLRPFPGAIAEVPQQLRKISDGTSNTIAFAEIRTRDDPLDERGVWALNLAGASLLALDMHNAFSSNVAIACRTTDILAYGVEAYSPAQQSVGGDDSTKGPNHRHFTNSGIRAEWLRSCPEASRFDGMGCRTGSTSGYAAPRSNHSGGVNASHVDGSVRWLADDIDSFLLARLISINDGEVSQEGPSQR